MEEPPPPPLWLLRRCLLADGEAKSAAGVAGLAGAAWLAGVAGAVGETPLLDEPTLAGEPALLAESALADEPAVVGVDDPPAASLRRLLASSICVARKRSRVTDRPQLQESNPRKTRHGAGASR